MKNMMVIVAAGILALAMVLAALVIVAVLTDTANAVNVMDDLNRYRAARGARILIPDAGLQAAAEASAQKQANRRRMGHVGTMPSSTAEGVGHGRLNPFSFRTCFNRPNDWGNSYRYGGAAIVGGYACLVLDKDRSHGAVGSGSGGRWIVRRGLFRRRR